MSNDLSRRPGSVMRAYTQAVRDHAAATQRAWETYTAALKRAEMHYFETMRHLNEELAKTTEPSQPAAAPATDGSAAEASPQ